MSAVFDVIVKDLDQGQREADGMVDDGKCGVLGLW